ncbi:MAG: YkvA family protein [Cyclobacteriaceae bacterium]|nr:YkvA family protein [Cyclobacteriaceae bacterium]
MEASKSKYFKSALLKASSVLSDNSRLKALLAKAVNKSSLLKSKDKSSLSTIEKLKVMVKLIRAYVNGTYRELPWNTIVKITAAILYFVMPLDLIPDIVPVTGFIDDFTVILWVWNSLQVDIEMYLKWERGNAPGDSDNSTVKIK